MTRSELTSLIKETLIEYLLEAPEDTQTPKEEETPEETTPEENQPIKPEPEPEIDKNQDALTPTLPPGRITIDQAKALMLNTKGREFAVKFVKKDGSLRTMTATLNPKRGIGRPRYNAAAKNLLPILDTVVNGIRIINLNTLQSLTIGAKTYTLSPTSITERKHKIIKLLDLLSENLTPKQKFFANKATQEKIAALPPSTPTEKRPIEIKGINYWETLLNINKGLISNKMEKVIDGIIKNIKKNNNKATEAEYEVLIKFRDQKYSKK